MSLSAESVWAAVQSEIAQMGQSLSGFPTDALASFTLPQRTVLRLFTVTAWRMAVEREVRDANATADLVQQQHADLTDILNALGLGDHARPISAHEVVQREVLPAIRALRESDYLHRQEAPF